MNLQWQIERFDALELRQLYQLLQLRQAVFAVEQQCIYQDLDNLDLESFHLLGCHAQSGKLLAYARCLPPGLKYPESSIGRVVVDLSWRGKGLGHALLRRAIDCCALFDGNEGGVQAIRISAQAYLEPFYRVHGFAPQGDCYIEDGIKHLEMLRSGESLVQDKNK
jgi:ElaA protein